MIRGLSMLAGAPQLSALSKGLPLISAGLSQQLAFITTTSGDAATAAPASTAVGGKPPLLKEFKVYRQAKASGSGGGTTRACISCWGPRGMLAFTAAF
jgi:hypothetical protein